ncbi:MAG: cell division protein FtsL [Candidatus Marinimicrobia bacterium]|nr:cell division protein FtsL [Candidatus Neomarinimicrobiota bacterium]
MRTKNVKTHYDIQRIRLIDNKIIFSLLLMIILVATLVGYMYIRNGLDSLISRNLTMKSNNAQLQQEIIYLDSEIINLSRPGQIQRIAQEQLGMVNSTPQADAIFVKKKK